MKKTIRLPSNLDMRMALRFSLEMQTLQEATEFALDFRSVAHVEPFGMLVIASEISRLAGRFPQTRIYAENHHHMGYAAHIGFFHACGFEIGKAVGQARGSDRYVPITRLECQRLIVQAARNGNQVGDEVEGESQRLAKTLCGEQDGPVVDTLAYSIRELMRNVIEHSGAEDIWLCAQFWPTSNRAEVAILDAGVGVRQTLSNNPHLDVSTHKRAVNYALMPAVSGKAFKGSRTKQKGHWANSGFGLYLTSRICRNGGTFLIASGDTAMLLTRGANAKRYFECNLFGTVARMSIKTNEIKDLRGSLEQYRKEGYEIQKRYQEIVSIDPSAASLMLSEDFNLSVWDRLLGNLKKRS